MKRLSLLLCFLGSLFACAGLSHALTIPASEDSSSYVSRLTTAGNNSGVLLVDATHKAYVYFDLSEVPTTAVVRWAKLRVFLPAVRVKGSGVKLHTVTAEWNEALQSAEPAISATPVATITPDKLATKRFVTVDVTSTVQDWINLKTPNEGFAFVTIPNASPSLVTAINFASKEGIMGGLPAELDMEFKPEGLDQLKDSLNPLLISGTFALNDVSQLPLTLRTFLSPSIIAQPSLPSFGGSLTVQAQGLGALTYDWKRNGVSVTGGTGAVLSTSGLLGGTYTVTVGNGFSAVTSGPVRVEDPLFALIPAGVFVMGNKDFLDAPEHLVDLSSFYVGRTEVTGDEWRNVLSWALENGYEFGGVGEFKGPNYPITDVNWYDALKWCNAKSEKEGLPPCYYTQPNFTPGTVYRTGQVDLSNSMVNWRAGGFRLPTEAEWEKAARGGLSSKLYPTGDTLTALNANINFSVGGTTPVKSYQPNGFGIYDMDGNVTEMCWDFYGPLDAAQATDPHGPSLGSNRVKRGGLWDNDLRYSMSAYRVGHDSPSFAYRSMGFRLFRSAPVEGFPLISAPVLSSTSLTVSAQGASPFSYQWYKDGAPLISGTSSTLSLVSLTSGTYSVMVSNSVGVSISSGLRVSDLVIVQGGSLPNGSELAGQAVSDFQIGRYEVTWGEWKAVRSWAVNNGYSDLADVGAGNGDNYPVTEVSWYDVVKWCNAKSEKEGKAPVYLVNGATYKSGEFGWNGSGVVSQKAGANGYRLPTEAEWEWAARGGRQTHGYTYSGSNDLNAVGWYVDNSANATHEVGTKAANELGISDLSGNVWEWCWDSPSSGGAGRRFRGGGWNGIVLSGAVSVRGSISVPDSRSSYEGLGFRLACSSGQ